MHKSSRNHLWSKVEIALVSRDWNKAAISIIWSMFVLEKTYMLDDECQAQLTRQFVEHFDDIRILWLVEAASKPQVDFMLRKKLDSLIVYDSEFFEPYYDLDPNDPTSLSWVQHLVAQNENLKYLRLDGSWYNRDVTYKDRRDHSVFKLSNQFRFEGQAPLQILALSPHAFRLSELELVNILQNCPRLTELKLYGVTVMPSPVPHPRPDNFRSDRIPILTDAQAYYEHTGLQRLVLTDTYLSPNFARHIPNVHTLSFRSVASNVCVTRLRL